MSTETLDTKTLNTEDFYKNLKPEDVKPLEEVVKILKEDPRVDVFAINKAAEQDHHKEYEIIDLLLERVNKTGYFLSLDNIKDKLGAKVNVTKTNNTIDDKSKYNSYVPDDRMVEIDYHRTKIRLFYTINGTGVSSRISL